MVPQNLSFNRKEAPSLKISTVIFFLHIQRSSSDSCIIHGEEALKKFMQFCT